MIIRPTGKRDHGAIQTLLHSLPEWFDDDVRYLAIPDDLCFQDGLVALKDDSIVGFITMFVAEGRLQIGWLAGSLELSLAG